MRYDIYVCVCVSLGAKGLRVILGRPRNEEALATGSSETSAPICEKDRASHPAVCFVSSLTSLQEH